MTATADNSQGRIVYSLSGVVMRAAESCQKSRDNKHLVYPLTLLMTHINQLRKHPEKLQAFLELWVED